MFASTERFERPADQIRMHLQRVSELRMRASTLGSVESVLEVKRLQAQRFRATYADFLSRPSSEPAVRFFLDELYGEHDFSRRDAQFGRIAGALEHMFPPAVAQLAVDLTETHALTEALDHDLAEHWASLGRNLASGERYVKSWRRCGQREARLRQLFVVQDMGRELQRLTRMKPLRFALRMMRNPARASGLDALQHFLETGFDAFAALGDALPFLDAVQSRESRWIEQLFDGDLDTTASHLSSELAKGLSS